MIPLPETATLIHYITKDFLIWINAYLPMAGLFLGIGLFGYICILMLNKFDDFLDWQDEKSYLMERKTLFQDLFGHKTGGSGAELYRLYEMMDKQEKNFFFPRDMRAGESFFSYLQPLTGAPFFDQTRQYRAYNFGREYLNPEDFKSESHGLATAKENFKRGTSEMWNKWRENRRYAKYERYGNKHPEYDGGFQSSFLTQEEKDIASDASNWPQNRIEGYVENQLAPGRIAGLTHAQHYYNNLEKDET